MGVHLPVPRHLGVSVGTWHPSALVGESDKRTRAPFQCISYLSHWVSTLYTEDLSRDRTNNLPCRLPCDRT